jgi:hypothetical protein
MEKYNGMVDANNLPLITKETWKVHNNQKRLVVDLNGLAGDFTAWGCTTGVHAHDKYGTVAYRPHHVYMQQRVQFCWLSTRSTYATPASTTARRVDDRVALTCDHHRFRVYTQAHSDVKQSRWLTGTCCK